MTASDRAIERAFVEVSDNTVTVKEIGNSTVILAHILDRDRDAQGNDIRLFLDRRIDRPHRANCYVGWRAWGAVSTVLERDASAALPDARPVQPAAAE